MVTALHPLAARTGVKVLQEGGNAVDALLAGLAVMSVVEPFMSGLGGHGAALVAMQGEPPVVIDGSATAPAAFPAGAAELRGGRSVSTPNAARAWAELHSRYASRELTELLKPAITMARSGVPVEWYTALMTASHLEQLRANEAAAKAFLVDGWRPPVPELMGGSPAESVANPDLAATLERFARNGAAELLSGETGARLVEAVSAAGGWLSESDLQQAPDADPCPALHGSFRGFTVHAGPAASAASPLIQMLGLLDQLDPELLPLGSADYYEQLIRAQEVARLDRDWLGDPRFTDAPLAASADPHLLALRRDDAQLYPGRPLPRRDLRQRGYPVMDTLPQAPAPAGSSTTHLNVVDSDGNMASATFTLGHPFGSGIAAAGTGLLLLNTLHQFASEPQHPNAPAPGKRAVWNATPVILTRAGQPVLSIGAPGGPRIPAAVAQVIVNHVIYGLSPQEAVQVPRVFSAGDVVWLDDRVEPEVAAELRRRGHQLELVRESFSSVNFARPGLISLDPQSSEWVGGIDEWRIGAVAAS